MLYKDHFEHKGPFYYLFIKFLSLFIGWCQYQYIFTLFSTLLVFYITIIYLIKKSNFSSISILICSLLSITLLIDQDSNSSIAFFKEGLLIISFIPLVNKTYN